jgi:hypothetical protein
VLASNIPSPIYTAVELIAGVIYQFKVESRNSYGYSAYSSSISLLCAYKPDPPLTVMTANSDNQVKITWKTPVTNGSPITSFKIYIRNIDLVFIQETSSCDGASTTIISDMTCNVSLQLLRALPYSLVKGDSVYVKIISVNVYGDSVYSQEANGAVIQYVPDAPISLTNND